MLDFIRNAWAGVAGQIWSREMHRQVAALCTRDGRLGREVLLITSRDTGRWILPKGWPVEGLDDPASALQEAWEEAGVRETMIAKTPLGHYHYFKDLDDGAALPVRVAVFAVEVDRLSDSFPEVEERERAWFAPGEAAELVDEPELKALLRSL